MGPWVVCGCARKVASHGGCASGVCQRRVQWAGCVLEVCPVPVTAPPPVDVVLFSMECIYTILCFTSMVAACCVHAVSGVAVCWSSTLNLCGNSLSGSLTDSLGLATRLVTLEDCGGDPLQCVPGAACTYDSLSIMGTPCTC